jgi:hypothetical protein
MKGNVMALIPPLSTQQMFAAMSYRWGLTLWTLLAAVMAPIPRVGKFAQIAKSQGFQHFMQLLFFFGLKMRSHNKVSREILETRLQQLDSDKTVVSSPIEEKGVKVFTDSCLASHSGYYDPSRGHHGLAMAGMSCTSERCTGWPWIRRQEEQYAAHATFQADHITMRAQEACI